MQSQATLLRVLAERQITPLGSESPIDIDVRVVSATNRDLEAEIEAGNFRDDLFWRLNVVPITMPPLRDRGDDIPLLARHFLAEARERNSGRGPQTFSVEAMVPGAPLPGRSAGAQRRPGPAHLQRGGDGAAAPLRLAGQRARAAQRDRTGRGAEPGR
jgi:hypothetical protein